MLLPLGNEFPRWYRSGARMLLREKPLAQELFRRLVTGGVLPPEDSDAEFAPFGFGVNPTGQGWTPSRLNDVTRVVRYGPGDRFHVHRDANHVAGAVERSCLTLMVYLDREYEGGDLVFLKDPEQLPSLPELQALVATRL
eukprot:Hpha_TRINITY_DN11995_c0_g2::TRINITY_DN11995_c0_g2_i1::g.20533::m.20533